MDASLFDLNSQTGVLEFKSAPDYEIKKSFAVTFTASDGANSTDINSVIGLNNLNDNLPEFTSGTNFAIDENSSANGFIPVVVTDADGDSLQVTITDSDNSAIRLMSEIQENSFYLSFSAKSIS